jgi:hypothetical protein
MFYLMASALFLSITICYLLSKKYSVALECVTPIFTLFSILIGIPTYYESPTHATIITGKTLSSILNSGYLYNSIVTCFFSANYAVTLVSRGINLSFLLFHAIRYFKSGRGEMMPTIFNYLTTVILNELNIYNVHRK